MGSKKPDCPSHVSLLANISIKAKCYGAYGLNKSEFYRYLTLFLSGVCCWWGCACGAQPCRCSSWVCLRASAFTHSVAQQCNAARCELATVQQRERATPLSKVQLPVPVFKTKSELRTDLGQILGLEVTEWQCSKEEDYTNNIWGKATCGKNVWVLTFFSVELEIDRILNSEITGRIMRLKS